MKIKLNWRAGAQGEDIIDLEDWDITDEDWYEMSDEARMEILQEYTNENYDGMVVNYNEIED